MDMASTCNNCTLKEKEQIYTSARDGNLLYLKVSLADTLKKASRLPETRFFSDEFSSRNLETHFLVLFILIRFFGCFCRGLNWTTTLLISLPSALPVWRSLAFEPLSKHRQPSSAHGLKVYFDFLEKPKNEFSAMTIRTQAQTIDGCEENVSAISIEGYLDSFTENLEFLCVKTYLRLPTSTFCFASVQFRMMKERVLTTNHRQFHNQYDSQSEVKNPPFNFEGWTWKSMTSETTRYRLSADFELIWIAQFVRAQRHRRYRKVFVELESRDWRLHEPQSRFLERWVELEVEMKIQLTQPNWTKDWKGLTE